MVRNVVAAKRKSCPTALTIRFVVFGKFAL